MPDLQQGKFYMRWKTGRRSRNIEDIRGNKPKRFSRGVKRGGIGTILIALAAMYFGIDPSFLLQGTNNYSATNQPQQAHHLSAKEKQLGEFVSVVLADTEDTWQKIFSEMGRKYKEPKLVLFTNEVKSACGYAKSAMGPFYCPADQKVYIDLGFYNDLKNRHNAPGDFAQAYVIAHEIGHHLQTLLGISQKVHQAKRKVNKQKANALSIQQELQADCLAGVWAHHAKRSRSILDPGDIEEALGAASAIGDDRLQKQARGYITPESFTHGSSEQRVRWFKNGFDNGSLGQCNTFKANRL